MQPLFLTKSIKIILYIVKLREIKLLKISELSIYKRRYQTVFGAN